MEHLIAPEDLSEDTKSQKERLQELLECHWTGECGSGHDRWE
jgi:hypothetical protein